MNQKGMIILFFVLAFVGIGVAGYSQFKEDIKVSPSPSPSPAEVKFNFSNPNPNSTLTPTSQPQTPEVKYQTVNLNGKQTKQFSAFPGAYPVDEIKEKAAVIETSKGKIVIALFPENPKAASNFLFLISQGFYDGLTFHRVEPGFVIQGGDPKGDGTGGPGYSFQESPMVKGQYSKGMVAMAKRADEPAGSGGSQFFIMLADTPLPPDYVIFGKVIQGQEVVDKINIGDVMQKVSIVKLTPSPESSPSPQ